MNVWIMCGLPGSGKSTIAKRIKDNHENVVIVSKDAIREMLYGEYAYVKSDEVMIKHMVLQMYFQVIKFGRGLILDATHLTRKVRLEIIDELQAISSEEIVFEIVLCEHRDSLENRLKDARSLPKAVWKEVFESMEKSFEIPECDECQVSYYKDLKYNLTLPRIKK